jgi:predicted transcriptional regulator
MQNKTDTACVNHGEVMAGDSEPDNLLARLNLQDTLRLSADGIAKSLGDLEARVMTVAWKLNRPLSARSVHEEVIRDHPVAIHTVITVLNKLVRKGLLRRDKAGGVFEYTAQVTEEQFRREVSRRAVEGILSLGPDAVAASFVDALAELEPERLASLARLIQERLKEGGAQE